MVKRRIILVAHDVRSAHNVGSLLRTADGLGVEKVYFSGYTPYPAARDDKRLPHVASRATTQISKTALGAEDNVAWEHSDDVTKLLKALAGQGFTIAALEQTKSGISLEKYRPTEATALVVGNEVDGLNGQILGMADVRLEIPMLGSKESYNVAIAAAIALYHLRY